MPAWEDYKRASRERGSLAFELYVVQSTPSAPPEAVRETLPRHLAYQAEREADGSLFLAGPMSDETGAEMRGTGLIVYRAASIQDARAIADADPMHAEGKRDYTLHRWLVNEGSLRLNVALSAQSVALG